MKTIVSMLAVVSAVSFLSVRAQDEEAAGSAEETTETSEAADGGETAVDDETAGLGSELSAIAKKAPEKIYHILPFCRMLEGGSAQVLTPGTNDWAEIQEGRFYPLGTIYRTTGAEAHLRIQFGTEAEVEIRGEASFGTRAQPLNEQSRTISLVSGSITVKLPAALKEGLFVVTAPGFKVVNPAGASRYAYRKTVDGDTATVRCVSGSLTIEGRHFKVLSMRAANEIKIRTSQDLLFTGLYGSRGDVLTRLDQGRVLVKDFETGEDKLEDKVLDWKLSPQTAIRIHRALPALGEKMAVTVMTFDAAGELKNRCAFTEKTVEVNSGELGPTSKKERDAIAKRAAEATEAVEAEAGATTEEAPAEESSSSGDDLDF